MTLFNPINSAGQSAFSPGVPRANAPEPKETARDEHGIESDPFYQPHIVEYHCIDTTRLIRRGRSPGSAKSPTPSGGKDWNPDE
jgi:hypothetical protein